MSSWTTYKGLFVPDTSSGDAGINLTDDLKALADRAPYQDASNPTVNDDVDDGFIPGSQWLNTSTLTMWVCTDNSSGAAKWRSLYRRIENAIVLAPDAGVGGTDNRAIQLDDGGNSRGTNAVDLQRVRLSNSEVASGAHSAILGGKCNTASRNSAVASGYYSTASGYSSHAAGGVTTASGDYSHSEGFYSSAAGYCSHSEGNHTQANGFASQSGGWYSIANGSVAHATGLNTRADAVCSHSGGYHSKAHLSAQWARSSGWFSAQIGTAQTTITQMMARTTDASSTELTLGGGSPGSTTRFNILIGQTLSCFINIVGREENGDAIDNASFLRQVLIRRDVSSTDLVDEKIVGSDIKPSGWGGVTISADNNSLKIAVSGAASTEILWMATVIASEVSDTAI